MARITTATSADSIMMEAIRSAVKAEIKDIIEQETVKAKNEIERRINKAADHIALSILNQYSVYSDQERIIIEVKKT